MSEESPLRMMREGGKLSLLTMVSRILGLLREMTRAAFMGTGWLADAFAVAFTLPNFLRRLFAEGSMTAAFIPTFTGYLAEKDEGETKEFLSAVFTVLVFLVGIIVAAGVAFAPWIVLLFNSGHHEEMSLLTQVMFPFLALVAVAAFLQGILNSIGIFTPSGMAPILFNICWIAVPYLLGSILGNPARAMAVGVLIGGLAQALCQLPAVLKAGYRFGFIGLARAFRNPGMKRVFGLIGPTIVGMAAYQINILVSTYLATNSGTGSIASLQYSLRLQELVLGVFVVSLGTVLLPDLAGAARSENWDSYAGSLSRGLRAMLLITIPVAVYSMIVGEDIVTLLFRHREFGADSVRLTSSVFFWHMSGLAFIAMNRVLAPAFYARGDTKTPTWAGLVSVAINVGLAFALVGPLKAPGIALALAGASAVNTLVLVVALLRARIPGAVKALAASGRYSLKLVLFSILAGLPVLLIRPFLAGNIGGWNVTLAAGVSLAATALAFGGIGLALLAISRDEMASTIVKALRRRGSKA
ncbi:MAG: murein biosynthesis integral membrane protein MurJ [Rectinemataceae bacterium]